MRCEAVFHGRVQGVGFRMTVQSIARDEGLVGWVRNEPDGTVRLVAEGQEEAIDRLFERLQSRMASNISRAAVSRADDSGRYNAFEIRH